MATNSQNICVLLCVSIALQLVSPSFVEAQDNDKSFDSLRMALQNSANDTIRMNVYEQLAYHYTEVSEDSALLYAEKALITARQLKLRMFEANALSDCGYHLMNLMNYPKALESLLEAQRLLEDPAIEKSAYHFSSIHLSPRQIRMGMLSRNHLFLALLYYVDIQRYNAGNAEEMFLSFERAKKYAAAIGDTAALGYVYWLLGRECGDRNQLDSALLLTQKALHYFSISEIPFVDRRFSGRSYVGMVYNSLGSIYWGKGHLDSALLAFRNGERINRERNNITGLLSSYSVLSHLFLATDKSDSSLLYARKALRTAKRIGSFSGAASSYRTISSVFALRNKADSAYAYLKLSANLNDSLNFERTRRILAYQNAAFVEQLRLKKLEELNIRAQHQNRTNALIAGIMVSALIAFLLFMNSRNRKKVNDLLKLKNLEIEQQKNNVEETLAELRLAQEQLVQKETAELSQKATELEMQALRAQMNPHFIFNSLNSINRFILQNNKNLASEFLTKFSKLVRMILQNSQASLITLESELESLNLYLELEALRFNYHFAYNITVPKELDIEALKVPPLIIQPFVENAIWHGLMPKEEKGRVDIELSQENDDLILKIADDGIGRNAASAATKTKALHKSMGLQITTARIAMLHHSYETESPVTFIDLMHPDGSGAGTEVIIKLPLVYD